MAPHDTPDARLILPGKRKSIPTERAANADVESSEEERAPPLKKRKTTTSKNSAPAASSFFQPRNATISGPPPPQPPPDSSASRAPNSPKAASSQAPPPEQTPRTEGPQDGGTRQSQPRKGQYNHRLKFGEFGRPTQCCAADYPKWRDAKSLPYTFLIYNNVETNEQGQLLSCRLHCAWCGLQSRGWTWTPKGQGLTSNFIDHFSERHGKRWAAAVSADEEHLHPNKTIKEDITLEKMFEKVRSMSIL